MGAALAFAVTGEGVEGLPGPLLAAALPDGVGVLGPLLLLPPLLPALPARLRLQEPCSLWYLSPFACLYALSHPGLGHLNGFSIGLPSLSSFSPPGPTLADELLPPPLPPCPPTPLEEVMRSRFAGGGCAPLAACAALTMLLLKVGRLRPGMPGVVALAPAPLDAPGAGKKRFGGAQAGRWSSLFDCLRERAENADKPLLPAKANSSSSPTGVPGMELPGVEKGELAE